MSLGNTETNPLGSVPNDPFIEGGVFMHELGHNLGLQHAGDVPEPNQAPNYLSVMNYMYVFSGISHATTPGSNAPVEELRELNYSDHELNTLVENNLNEAAGVSPLSSGYTGIVHFFTPTGGNGAGPEAGPIDWNANGVIDPSPVAVNVNGLNGLNGVDETMRGYRDWDHDALTGVLALPALIAVSTTPGRLSTISWIPQSILMSPAFSAGANPYGCRSKIRHGARWISGNPGERGPWYLISSLRATLCGEPVGNKPPSEWHSV